VYTYLEILSIVVIMMKYRQSIENPARLRAMTGLASDVFHALLACFQHTLLQYMDTHTIDGYLREGRKYSSYQNSPLPTDADKLFFILTYLRHNPTQTVHGHMFGMSQSNASKWINVLHEVLNRTLAQQQVLPARDAATLAKHLQMAQLSDESDVDGEQDTISPLEREQPPLFFMMGRNDRSIDR
jgi:Helix-turn-helix of DDE superfamily endonuclease